jgi:hypothetical protein
LYLFIYVIYDYGEIMILVNRAGIKWDQRIWYHMTSDTSLEELHKFATEKLGLRREWFQDKKNYPHYDITESKRALAITLGAVSVDSGTMLKCCRELKQYGS